MQDEYTMALHGLLSKQAELTSELAALRFKTEQKLAALDAIDTAIRVFKPDIDAELMPERPSRGKSYSGVLNAMPRGYRYAILATFGLLLGATQPDPSNRAQQQGPASNQASEQITPPAIPALVRTLSADSPDTGCERDKDKRTSDLCAQWKAADAGYAAAQWGWWQLLLTGAGLLIGGGTLYSAYMAARYARDAARETKRGADAAEAATLETRRVGEAQVRCYLFMEHAALKVDQFGQVFIILTMRNTGQSPAENFHWSHEITVSRHPGRTEAAYDQHRTGGQRSTEYPRLPGVIIPAQQSKTSIPTGTGFRLTDEEFGDYMRPDRSLSLQVTIGLFWQDVFNNKFDAIYRRYAFAGGGVPNQIFELRPENLGQSPSLP